MPANQGMQGTATAAPDAQTRWPSRSETLMPVNVIIPALDQQIGWATDDERRALEHLREFLLTGHPSAHAAAREVFPKLQGKQRETFLFFIREGARHVDSEARAKALWEIAKVRAFGSPEELSAAISAGEVPRVAITRLLLTAMHNGNWGMAEVLIKNGADLVIQTDDEDAYTPLHYAVWYDHAGITRVLMDHGADPHKINGRSKSALQMAHERRCSSEVIALLSGKNEKRKRWGFWKRDD